MEVVVVKVEKEASQDYGERNCDGIYDDGFSRGCKVDSFSLSQSFAKRKLKKLKGKEEKDRMVMLEKNQSCAFVKLGLSQKRR